MKGLPSLAALAGDWDLRRKIHHDDGRVDRFEGECQFKRAGLRLIQEETGWLYPDGGGAPLRGTRSYVWTLNGRRIDIGFDDMRPFHSIPLGAGQPGATYLCPPDRYEVAYDFRTFPVWSSVWRVDGPRKAYRMENRFTRRGDGPD